MSMYKNESYAASYENINNNIVLLKEKITPTTKIIFWMIFQLFLGLLLNADSIGHIQGRVHPDEQYHLRIIEESLSAHSLTMPLHNGEPWYTKPPLLLWLGYGIGKLTGLGALGGMRIVSVLSWILCSWLIFVFVTKSLNSLSKSLAESQAVKTAILSTSCLSVLSFCHFGMMDIPMLASLLSIPLLTLCWWESGQRLPQTIALTLALIIGGWWKGPVFYCLIFLPTLVVIPRPYDQQITRIFIRFSPWIILSLIIGNGWILWNLYLYGGWYLQKFIFGENLARINGVGIGSLIKFLLIGSLPFWREIWGESLQNYNTKMNNAHARSGLMLALSTILIFGFCTSQHFHWFIAVPVGLLLWNGIPGDRIFQVSWLGAISNYLFYLAIPALTFVLLIFTAYCRVPLNLVSQISLLLISFWVMIIGYKSIKSTQRATLGVAFTLFWGTLIWVVTPNMFYNHSGLILSKTTPLKLNTSVRKFNQHNSKKINTALIAVLKSPSESSFDKLTQSLVIEVEPPR